VAQLAWADIHGDEVTLHNVRNCDCRSETDYAPRWATRKARIPQTTGLDLAINYWGSPWMAHPIAEVKKRVLINSVARAANDAPEFSRRIRAGGPGFRGRDAGIGAGVITFRPGSIAFESGATGGTRKRS
jgi:hypothetical protein